MESKSSGVPLTSWPPPPCRTFLDCLFLPGCLTPTVWTAGCWEDVTMHLSSGGSTLPEKLNFPPPASLVEEKYFWTASSPTFLQK